MATATFADGTTQNVTAQSTWQSSIATVATVSASGVVTATGPGQAEIRASYQNVAGALHITVAASRRFTLLGVVTQAGSSSPVHEASVSVINGVNAGRSTSTDGNGFYNLGGLQAGSFTLEALKAGYAAADNAVNLTGDLRFNFSLKANGPPAPVTLRCNASPWSHVYDSSRLRLVDSCRTVTGTITDPSRCRLPLEYSRGIIPT